MKNRSIAKQTLPRPLLGLLAAILIAAPWAVRAQASDGEPLEIRIGRSEIVELPWPVSQVSVAEPTIADVQIARSNQIVVLAKATGETDVVLWNDKGETYHKVIRVIMELGALTSELNRYFPGANLEATQFGKMVTVSGTFRRAEDTARLHTYLDAAGIKYADMTSVAGVQQVLIKVKIAEASRQALRTLGIDTIYTGKDFFGGTIFNHLFNFTFNPSQLGNGPNALTGTFANNTALFAGVPDADVQVFFNALEDNQYVRILAEPSLTALSGEEASFLAGGEFPVPVVQNSGGTATSTSITIEWKEFGVRLRFRPTVMGDGAIHLKVAPEVSSLNFANAIEISGFRIPAIDTRRSETTLEMHSGQTFVMAGLLNQETLAQTQKIPGLGSIPVLGPLFRSVRYQNHDTEMVLLATVELVEPLSITGKPPVPGDLHDQPSDWDLYVNGRIESREPRTIGPVGQQWTKDKGLDDLSGPGAWESSNTPPSPQLQTQATEPVTENKDQPNG